MISHVSRPSVLIVEDSVEVLEATRCLVQEGGYSVVCAADGHEALWHLSRMNPLPDVILLDLMMPLMDGWQVLNELQRNAVFSNIPVILVSALDLDAPCFPQVTAYLRKPVNCGRLLAVLADICDTAPLKDRASRVLDFTRMEYSPAPLAAVSLKI